MSKSDGLEKIRAHIAEFGSHVYSISGGAGPRFVYSIGNLDRFGWELILTGGAYYGYLEATDTINEIADHFVGHGGAAAGVSVTVSTGTFDLGSVDPTWVEQLMLGATHYYGERPVTALQVLPDRDHRTIDVPDMSQPLADAPVWRWVIEPWPYPVDEESVAMTDLAALRGEPITQAMRWEDDYWEMFANPGSEVAKEDARAVPLGTLLAYDPSLEPVTRLPVGKGLWREQMDMPWANWGK